MKDSAEVNPEADTERPAASDSYYRDFALLFRSTAAQDVHHDVRGEYTGGRPCMRGWFDDEASARAALAVFEDFEALVAEDGNGPRKWFWLCVVSRRSGGGPACRTTP